MCIKRAAVNKRNSQVAVATEGLVKMYAKLATKNIGILSKSFRCALRRKMK